MLKQYYYDGVECFGYEDLEFSDEYAEATEEEKSKYLADYTREKFLTGILAESAVLLNLSIQATPGTEVYITKPITEEFSIIGPNGVLELDIPNIKQVTFGANSPALLKVPVRGSFIRVLAEYGEGG